MRGYAASSLLVVFLATCAHDPAAPLMLKGKWHRVQPQDTIAAVAAHYGADAEALAELNDVATDAQLRSREEIFVPIPSGEPPGTGAPPKRVVKPVDPARPQEHSTVKLDGRCVGETRLCLMWPVQGKILAAFGKDGASHHDGIDIEAREGTSVRAAADGQVLYSGSRIEGYGNLLILRHAQKLVTVYAHNKRNLVNEGDAVKQGQIIAEVGNSGSAATAQLHFEVRVEEKPQDPMNHLVPRREAGDRAPEPREKK